MQAHCHDYKATSGVCQLHPLTLFFLSSSLLSCRLCNKHISDIDQKFDTMSHKNGSGTLLTARYIIYERGYATLSRPSVCL